MFLITPEPYEPEAVAAVRDWFGKTGRPVYVCGPLLPPTSATATAKEQQQSTEAVQIQEFLDTTLKTSGEKSLLYVRACLDTFGVWKRFMSVQISFGSLFWPVKTPEKMWAVLDVVMERGIPFVSASDNACAQYKYTTLIPSG